MTPVQESNVKQRLIDHSNLCMRNKHIFLSINESCRGRPVIFTVAPFVITVHLYHKHNLTLMLRCLKKASRSTFNMSFGNQFSEKKKKKLLGGKNRAAAILSPFRKCPLTPIIPPSTCPLHCEFPSLLAHPLSWVICCVNTVYLQLTGPFGCGAGNAITGSKHLHCYHWRVRRSFRSPLQRGPLLIGISFEEGITNEAVWKPFVLGKEPARTCVCVCLFTSSYVCVYKCVRMCVQVCKWMCERGRQR